MHASQRASPSKGDNDWWAEEMGHHWELVRAEAVPFAAFLTHVALWVRGLRSPSGAEITGWSQHAGDNVGRDEGATA